MSPVKRIVTHSVALANFSELLFVVVFSAISIGMSAGLQYCLVQFNLEHDERVELLRYGVLGFFAIAILISPPVETLLFQQIPILIARRLGLPLTLQLAMGAVPFAVTHFQVSLVSGVTAGVVGGVVLSVAYLTFISESKIKAFAITTAIHLLHNLVPFLIYASRMS